MDTILEMLKNIWLNHGWSHPWALSLTVAFLAVAAWWIYGGTVALSLRASGSRSEAASSIATPTPGTTSTPTTAQQSAAPSSVQQSGSVSGSGTINQAGRDQTINQTIINQGVPVADVLRMLQAKAIAAEEFLRNRYPEGFVLLGIADGQTIFEPRYRNFYINQADWGGWRIGFRGADRSTIILITGLTVITSNTGFRSMQANNANVLPFVEGQPNAIDRIGGTNVLMYFEILDAEKLIFVVGFRDLAKGKPGE